MLQIENAPKIKMNPQRFVRRFKRRKKHKKEHEPSSFWCHQFTQNTSSTPLNILMVRNLGMKVANYDNVQQCQVRRSGTMVFEIKTVHFVSWQKLFFFEERARERKYKPRRHRSSIRFLLRRFFPHRLPFILLNGINRISRYDILL